MYVCLCVGATNQTVSDAVAQGASTSKEIAAMCGAGGDCGRCRRTLRAILAASSELHPRGIALADGQAALAARS
jgi:bacterioferritin-associated ferredoxin